MPFVRGLAFGLVGAVALVGTTARADPRGPNAGGTVVVRVSTPSATKDAPPRAVAGAAVVASDESGEHGEAVTDAEGVARIQLPVGDYTVRADADRFAGEENDITVAAGQQARVAITLAPGVPFDGTVVDDETGSPVPGASVSVGAHGAVGGFMSTTFRSPYARTKSDAKGRFHVNGVPEGQVATVEVVANGHGGGAFPLRILGGRPSPSPVVVRLPLGGAVTGLVRAADGRAVSNATVYVMPAASEELRGNPRGWRMSQSGKREQSAIATTGADGRYRVEGLPLGIEYVAVAEAEGFARSEEVLGLSLAKSSREATADLVLRPAATLIVRLADPGGRPITKATVELGSSAGPTIKQDAPEAGGVYRFAGLAPGEWPVSVTAQGFRPTWTKAVVEAGKTATVTVKLDPGVSIEGFVVDEDGKPVPGASVSIETVGGNDPGPDGWTTIGGRDFEAGPDGRFAAKGLPPKDADVTAQFFRVFHGAEKNRWATLAPLRVKPPNASVRLVLVARGTAVIRLLAPDGKPYRGEAAMVWEEEVNAGGSGSGRTIEDGNVVFTGLDDGDHSVHVDIDGYAPVARTFHAQLRKQIDLGTATLEPGLDVPGRVLDAAGAPVPGARVWSDRRGAAAADEHGGFRLAHQPKGALTLTIDADGFLRETKKIDVAPKMDLVEIRLPRGATVRCVLGDADGKPLDGERLVSRPVKADGKLDLDPAREEWEDTADGGRATFRLRPGSWRILYAAPDPEAPLGDFALVEGETRDVVLTLPR